MFNVSNYSIKDKTAKFDLYPIVGEDNEAAYLLVHSATESNVEYRNALMKTVLEGKDITSRKKTKLSARELDDSKEKLLPLYAKHVIKGFENLPSSDGADTTYSEEKALELLKEIDQHLPELLTELMNFCQDASNFLDIPANANVEDLAGN